MQDDSTFGGALDLVRDLRKRCDWDRVQTRETLRPYLREEVAELDEALAAGDEARIAAELGDLVLHICFQLVIAEERGTFTFADVTEALGRKMRRRHPHLFAGETKPDWERFKAEERRREHPSGEPPSVLGALPPGLPDLERAYRFQERAAAVGFDWDDLAGPFDKLEEEVREARAHPQAEIGDVLFAAVNVARKAGVHPSVALRAATDKFVRRFRALEQKAAARGVELGRADLAALDRLWDEVKAAEATG
ncbi:MAG: nucleoside triphosphate pyrophosphohydrolase [Gemmatimonadales bacterium]|jgi:MazG family protein